MASELLLAALLACQHSTSVKVAAKRRATWHVERLAGSMAFDDTGDIARIEVVFTLTSDAADAAIETILRLTEKSCTISRAIRVPVTVRYARKPAGPAGPSGPVSPVAPAGPAGRVGPPH